MARLLLIICAFVACVGAPVYAQNASSGSPPSGATPPAVTSADIQPPPARLIKPKTTHTETHLVDHPRRPLDDRCRPLKDQLELALQKPGNQHRLFQARLAHNAGARLCREGHADKGIAELQRGLSYLQETPH
jgi:hypothetical protein